LDKKKALITGASSGIGFHFCHKLFKEGYQITAIARSEEKLADLVLSLGDGNKFIKADLTVEEEVNRVIKELKNNHYNLLINNAGIGLHGYFEEYDLDQYQKLMSVNMHALVKLTYHYLHTAEAGDAIINVSSALSEIPYPGGAVYSGTKGFVTNFTEALWYENKDKDIYFMTLLPGITKTNFQRTSGGNKYKISNGHGDSPELVVDEAVRELKKRKSPSLVSGPKFRYLLYWAKRLFTKKQLINMIAYYSPASKENSRKKKKDIKTSDTREALKV
jgi:hypothetical protein